MFNLKISYLSLLYHFKTLWFNLNDVIECIPLSEISMA